MLNIFTKTKTLVVSSVILGGILPAKSADYQKIKEGLMSLDSSILSAALDHCTTSGKEILPTLRKWSASDDPRLSARAKTALGRATGQWSNQTDLVWEKSFEDAVKRSKEEQKPIMVLQLFGNFNEEFC